MDRLRRVLQEALSVLEPEERDQFEDLVARELTGLIRGPGAERWMCRSCDVTACGRAAQERYSSSSSDPSVSSRNSSRAANAVSAKSENRPSTPAR